MSFGFGPYLFPEKKGPTSFRFHMREKKVETKRSKTEKKCKFTNQKSVSCLLSCAIHSLFILLIVRGKTGQFIMVSLAQCVRVLSGGDGCVFDYYGTQQTK